jgi:hypothetical protein
MKIHTINSIGSAVITGLVVAILMLWLNIEGVSRAERVPEPVSQAQKQFTELFKRAKEQAAPGCHAVGGRLWVGVDQKSGAVTVSCEIR